MQPWPYPRWIAHRGAGKLAPENTLAAFRRGAQLGYRMAECDVQLSADAVPFLLHDPTLERTTNGHGSAGALTWSALSQLDAGSWHSRPAAGEPLPTLQNVARWCRANDRLLNIEIKAPPGQERRTGEVVATQARRLWRGAAVAPLLSSFQPEALDAAQTAAPELPRALLIDSLWSGWLERARSLGCVALVCDHALWDAALVARARREGLRCLSYTVNEERFAQRLIELGTDGIITDRVDLFAPE